MRCPGRGLLAGVATGCCILLSLPGVALGAADPHGALTQLSGAAGCIDGSGSTVDGVACTDARGAGGAFRTWAIALSPDGKSLYAGYEEGSAFSDTGRRGLLVFARDPATGALAQRPGTAGCITADGAGEDASNTCTNARAIGGGRRTHAGVAVSPDGKFVYAASDKLSDGADGSASSVTVFSRDATTGELTQLAGTQGCVTPAGASEDGPGTCADGRALEQATQVQISPDGETLYALSHWRNTIAVFSRDADTGALTQLAGTAGCITDSGGTLPGETEPCAAMSLLSGPVVAAVAPDSGHVYVPIYDESFTQGFARDGTTGALTPLAAPGGCASGDTSTSCTQVHGSETPFAAAFGPRSDRLYLGDISLDAVAVVDRDPGTGSLSQPDQTDVCVSNAPVPSPGCLPGRVHLGIVQVAVAPDGRTLYGVGGRGLVADGLDPATGRFTGQLPGLLGCTVDDGSSGNPADPCTDGRFTGQLYSVAVSGDNRSVYAGAEGTLAIFRRALPPRCDAVAVSTPPGTAVSVPLSCTDHDGDTVTRSIVSTPAHGSLSAIDQTAGNVTYTPAAGYLGADTFTFAAGDGTNTSAPASVSLTVAAPPPADAGGGDNPGGGGGNSEGGSHGDATGPRGDSPGVSEPGSASDRVAPSLAVRRTLVFTLARVLEVRGLNLPVSVGEPASVRVTFMLSESVARRLGVPRKLASGSARGRGGRLVVRLRLAQAAQESTRLRNARRVRARVLVSATDSAGNTGTLSTKATLQAPAGARR